MNAPSCGGCRFYQITIPHPTDMPELTDSGQCRRYAPRPGAYVSGGWITLSSDNWCGEFEAAPLGPRATVPEEINYLATCVDRLATGLTQLLQRP